MKKNLALVVFLILLVGCAAPHLAKKPMKPLTNTTQTPEAPSRETEKISETKKVKETNETCEILTKKIAYGSDKRNIILFEMQKNHVESKRAKIVIVVHGGGFVGGSVGSTSTKILRNFFLNRGYSVISVEYRVCPNVKWPTPVVDVADGINKALSELKKTGFVVEEVTCVGSSAGATALALILYSNKYPSISEATRFIGFDGIYNPDSITSKASTSISLCNSSPKYDLAFDGKLKVPALLIEGESDCFDANPMTSKSHAEYLAGILKSKSIYAETCWMTKEDAGTTCGHGCPVHLLESENKKLVDKIEKFMQKVS